MLPFSGCFVSGSLRDTELAALRQEIAELRAELAKRNCLPAKTGSVIGLNDVDASILLALKDCRPRAVCLTQIEADSGISRQTIAKRLPGLINSRLVQRLGKRGGISLAESGLELAMKLDARRNV